MKKILLALMLGTVLLPIESFANDPHRRWNAYGRDDHYTARAAHPSDPGYYCHRHERKIHRDDVRRHCHSAYSDPHGVYTHERRRSAPSPWWRRR